MTRTPPVIVMAAMLVAAACSGPPEAPAPPAEPQVAAPVWTEVADADLNDEQRARQQRGLDAIQAMSGRLMGELTAALDGGDATAAIEVCSHRAPEISAAVANEYGLMLGRTSDRLRNRSNLPPTWAEPLVARRVAEPTWLVGPDGELAGLVPIRLKAECAMCHGPREQIADEVLARIDDFYPGDEAVGFAEGDLRGWFWVETPSG
ncbi:MAG: DUF3365 domain-containing protein [Thermoanaerobaculales bacterium]|nr:DUF3365 domain-containing protein [Thermoanaerobaculales bacterium]